MKNTKKIILGTSLFLALGGVSASASVETLWAKGVTQAGGWVDFNKSNTDPNDNRLCWAAASSNVIHWWQRQYDIPEGVPEGEEIWEKFKDSFTDEGSHPEQAFRWWFSGTYSPPGTADYAAQLKDSRNRPRYYPKEEDCIAACMGEYDAVSDFIISSLKDGCATTLGLSFRHEVTIWGIEYNTSSNDITKLWLTDSDDYVDKIFAVDCYEYVYMGSETYLGIENFPGRGDALTYATMATTLKPAKFLQPIPEPSAFGLFAGLGALALVASRRRRK